MTPISWMYFGLILFIMLPVTILLVGSILSYFASKHRKAIGILLTVVGSVELLLWLYVTGTLEFLGVSIYVMTVAAGIFSIIFAHKTRTAA
jgi:hypothetical protein